MSLQLSALYRYPLKSARGEALSAVALDLRGLRGDRRWMVVDASGRFVSARSHPHLLGIEARLMPDGLALGAAGVHGVRVQHPSSSSPRMRVEVWGSAVDALPADPAAGAWLSARLGMPVHLVWMDEAAVRPVDPAHSMAGDEVSFADGFPLLLIGSASLDELNRRAAHSLDMRRFRPNLVVRTTTPHEEDGWRRIRVGAVVLELPKPCVRCVLTTLDPDHATPDPAGEPLASLKAYRRSPKGITFGMNAIARTLGELRVGDGVAIID